MAIDLERTMDRVLQMAEASQKAKGIDNFGSQGYRNALERDKATAQRTLRDQQLLDEEKLKATERMTTRAQDIEEAKAEATLANANAIQQSKNWNALQVADIRANGGLGRKDPSVMTAHEETQAAIEWAKANPGLPGKPGMSIEEARAAIRPKAAPVKNADGTISTTAPATASATAPVVPTAATAPVAPVTAPVATPKGEAPTALSANQWQQYADSKSPGMKYEGNQPGMVGDQIARFKRADGSAFFANTGAAKMQMGDALTPAPTTPLVNTPGVEPRATMPDAANRSAMNTAGIPIAKDPSIAARLGQDFKGAMGAFNTAFGSERPEDMTTRELPRELTAQPIKSVLGMPAEIASPVDGSITSVPANENSLATRVTKRAANNMRQNMVNALTPRGYKGIKAQPSESTSSLNITPQEFVETGTEPYSKKAQGFLNWYEQAASRNMPAYLQSRAAMQPVDAGQKMSDLFKWWKDKSGRNMPKYAYPGSNM